MIDNWGELRKLIQNREGRSLNEHELTRAVTHLSFIVSQLKNENNMLKNQIRAVSGYPLINFKDPKAKVDEFSLYMYLQEFWPEVFHDYKDKIQSSKKFKAKKFTNLKQANEFVWTELIKPKDNESLFVLSKWVEGMGISHHFRTKQEFITACLCYMDYKGYLDKEGKTFNKLGDIKRGSFRFNSDEETYAILTDTFDTVGKYKSGIEKFKLKIKELKEND